MARFCVSLLSCFTISIIAATGYDSSVETGLTYQVCDSYDCHDLVVSSLSVAEVPTNFVICHPNLGSKRPVPTLIKAKPSRGYIASIRGPPETSLLQKS